jgi:hypothetical protein
MSGDLRVLAAAGTLLCVSATNGAFAQTKGGIPKSLHFDSPASMLLHEEATAAVNGQRSIN